MKINAINSYIYTPAFKSENKPSEPVKNTANSSKKNMLIYGTSAIAAIGLAAFAIIKARKSPVKAIHDANETITKQAGDIAENLSQKVEKAADDLLNKEISKSEKPQAVIIKETDIEPVPAQPKEQPKAPEVQPEPQQVRNQPEILKTDTSEPVTIHEPKNELDMASLPEENELDSELGQILTGELEIEKSKFASNITGIEENHYSTTPIGSDKAFDCYEKMIYTDNGDGTGHTYSRFYHNDKMYECQVWDDVLANKNCEPAQIVRYNYAYDNGKLVGVAKQTVFKDKNSHGRYLEDGTFEPFRISVKMKGDKDFKETKLYMVEELYKMDKRFDPENL